MPKKTRGQDFPSVYHRHGAFTNFRWNRKTLLGDGSESSNSHLTPCFTARNLVAVLQKRFDDTIQDDMKLRENLKLLVVIVDTSATPPLHYHHRLHLLQVTYDWPRDGFIEFISSLGFDVEIGSYSEERQC